jgi:hypothetical protein
MIADEAAPNEQHQNTMDKETIDHTTLFELAEAHLMMLDVEARRAKIDIDDMSAVLDAGLDRAQLFLPPLPA